MAFSTFLFVVMVMEVQHELAVLDQVEVLLGLASLSQGSVSAMLCLVTASKSFSWCRTSTEGACRKVSKCWKKGNCWLEIGFGREEHGNSCQVGRCSLQ